MPTYLDIGAVRIQSWLARTPQLRLRRGASAALADAMSRSTVAPQLPDGVRWNDEAGDVDGVINLLADAGTSEESLERAGMLLLQGLRRKLPAVDFEMRIGSGPGYLDAYGSFRSKPQPPAVAAEIPIYQPCAACSLDPGLLRADLGPERHDELVCRDCEIRAQAAGSAGRVGHEPFAARKVRDWIASAHPELADVPFPEDLEQLARSGPPGSSTNHVATVFADGNRIGAMIGELRRIGGNLTKSQIAGAIDESSKESVLAALQPQLDQATDLGVLPISPHIAGGDDLLVTLPAGLGWIFTTKCLRTFGDSMSRQIASRIPRAGTASLPDTTMSAGIVFHHYSFPLSLAIEAAERAMTTAKRRFRGEQAAISWIEITADGHLAEPKGPWSLTSIEDRRGQLTAVAGSPRSQQARVARMRDEDVADQLRRMNLKSFVEVGSGWSGTRDNVDPARLREALQIARWWQ